MTNLTNGADVYPGDDTSETVNGLGGADILKGKGGNDYLYGDGEDDWINGGAGNDYMEGGTGNDTFEVGSIYSGMVGGLNSGWDTYIGGEGSDRILISSTYGYVWTAIMIDHIEGVETIVNGSNGPGYIYVLGNVDFTGVTQWINMDAIIGSSWADTIHGSDFVAETIEAGNGNDFIEGGGGNDWISGDLGNDTLIGAEGSDTLTGGSGNDTFVFNVGFGQDVVMDFTAGAGTDDVLEFKQLVFADLQSLLSAAAQIGSDVIITADVDNTITLKNVTLSNLHADDFRFVA